jgi:N-acetylglutamate synthase-like GNAT family acetyltransferase
MASDVQIQHEHELPADLDEVLMPEAVREGFKSLHWLREEWEQGHNRFSAPGEAFYVARLDGRLAGVCGLNRDPFRRDSESARLRRLYVLPEFRRLGIGRGLVTRAMQDAGRHFEVLGLRTFDAQSAAFFEALGFRRVEGAAEVTHEVNLAAPI